MSAKKQRHIEILEIVSESLAYQITELCPENEEKVKALKSLHETLELAKESVEKGKEA